MANDHHTKSSTKIHLCSGFFSFSITARAEFWYAWARKHQAQVVCYFLLLYHDYLWKGTAESEAVHIKMGFFLHLQASFLWFSVPLFYSNAAVVRGHWLSIPVSRRVPLRGMDGKEWKTNLQGCTLCLTHHQTGYSQQATVVPSVTKLEKQRL